MKWSSRTSLRSHLLKKYSERKVLFVKWLAKQKRLTSEKKHFLHTAMYFSAPPITSTCKVVFRIAGACFVSFKLISRYHLLVIASSFGIWAVTKAHHANGRQLDDMLCQRHKLQNVTKLLALKSSVQRSHNHRPSLVGHLPWHFHFDDIQEK